MTEITLPKAGQSMEDGTIVAWRKSEGDAVAAGDILAEVETDKAVVEVESNADGVLRKVLVQPGQTVPVHTPIAIVAGADEDISAAVEKAASSAPQPAAPAASGPAPTPAAPPENVTEVVMPRAGQSVEEATIVNWKVQPGDQISEGDVIFEIETD